MVEYSAALAPVSLYAYPIAKEMAVMNTLELRDSNATVSLTESEVKLLCVMTQYWIEELPDDDDGTRLLSHQLRELACTFDIH